MLRHARPTNATIVVADLSEDAKAERQRKLDAGAEVVPFGFARALAKPSSPERSGVGDVWEGMGL